MKRKEHGLLFKAPMILALKNTVEDVWPAVAVDESLPFKWQTRRTMDPQPSFRGSGDSWHWAGGSALVRAGYGAPYVHTDRCAMERAMLKVAPHPVGTIIYAKETWAVNSCYDYCKPSQLTVAGMGGQIAYRAGGGYPFEDLNDKWRTAMFLPSKFARLWFEVMAVRVERVNTISEADANAEGCPSRMSCQTLNPACCDYAELWDSINGKGDFAKGKWVWVYALRRISQKELARLRAEA